MKKRRKSNLERKENMPFNLDRNIIKDSFRGRGPIEKPWYVWYSFDMFINLADELAEARFTLLELRNTSTKNNVRPRDTWESVLVRDIQRKWQAWSVSKRLARDRKEWMQDC